ncbi:hypothetical protein, partial [Pseudomonas ogarae]|uniref:hypothetical protein n=1 Tax=Pseudomonas ogarae (strain DSM 112162 / CECT 30235 / F113) TaxID=1114970 RepID=UPI001F40546C
LLPQRFVIQHDIGGQPVVILSVFHKRDDRLADEVAPMEGGFDLARLDAVTVQLQLSVFTSNENQGVIGLPSNPIAGVVSH